MLNAFRTRARRRQNKRRLRTKSESESLYLSNPRARSGSDSHNRQQSDGPRNPFDHQHPTPLPPSPMVHFTHVYSNVQCLLICLTSLEIKKPNNKQTENETQFLVCAPLHLPTTTHRRGGFASLCSADESEVLGLVATERGWSVLCHHRYVVGRCCSEGTRRKTFERCTSLTAQPEQEIKKKKK